MAISQQQLQQKKCAPCEGGVAKIGQEEAAKYLEELSGWELSNDGKRIRRQWVAKNFLAVIDFFQKVANLAEEEDHHPDLHLTDYKNATVELTTHAIGGLSENDFVLAAKINGLPILTRSQDDS